MSLKREVDRIIHDLENPDGSDAAVMFEERPWYNEEESTKQGRPVYENRVFITKHKDKLSVYVNRATDEDIAQYPRQYEAFQKRRQSREAGIPIGMLPAITPAQRATCEACRIYTVEKLAEADEKIMAVLRMPELKERALEYLGKSAKMSELQAEIDALKKKLGEKDEPVNDLPKRRGRKPAIREADGDNQQ